jgi:segregation and condensation protein B
MTEPPDHITLEYGPPLPEPELAVAPIEVAVAEAVDAPAEVIAAEPAAPPPAPDPALFDHALRIAEALIFASDRPIQAARLQQALPPGVEAGAVLTALAAQCASRPVQLAEVAGGFAFRTAPELAPAITRVVEVPRRLPRAAMETLAIIAYHQPVTRAEIEEIRGASLSQTTLESLLELGLIAPRGRKEVPGRPSLWATTPRFLEQFGLRALSDLPRREELVNEPGAPPGPRAAAPAGPATAAHGPA